MSPYDVKHIIMYVIYQWRIGGGGTGVITSPQTCPDPENICKVCVRVPSGNPVSAPVYKIILIHIVI